MGRLDETTTSFEVLCYAAGASSRSIYSVRDVEDAKEASSFIEVLLVAFPSLARSVPSGTLLARLAYEFLLHA